MLKVVHDASASNEAAGGSLLDEIVRDGARRCSRITCSGVCLRLVAICRESSCPHHRGSDSHRPWTTTRGSGQTPHSIW